MDGHPAVAEFDESPRPFGQSGRVVDVDARRTRDRSPVTLEQVKMRAAEISTVIGARDRERLTKFAWTVGEKARARRLGAPLRHELEAFDGLERANQNRVRVAFSRHDDVEGPARSIKEVHVGVSGWTEHGFGAFGAAFRAVRREIGGTTVPFPFPDPSPGPPLPASLYHNFSSSIPPPHHNRPPH